MRILLVLCVLVLGSTLIKAQPSSVLFIGNSYTYYNTMPETLKDIALSAGDTLYVESITKGGARFSTHANNPEVYQKLRSRNWDYVIIQGQSQEPSFPDSQVNNEVAPYVEQLIDSIVSINRCTTPILFMTWGRKNGDNQNCAVWPPVCTYQGMDSILRLNYIKFGNQFGAEVSPVGVVWNGLRKVLPSLELYAPDESHPSAKGSEVIAYTFYSVITEKSIDSINFTGLLNAAELDALTKVLEAEVKTSGYKYNLGWRGPFADGYAIDMNDSLCKIVITSPLGYDSHFWDFGDGNTSTIQNPVHRYENKGTYQLTYIVTNCGRSDTSYTTIDCSSTTSIELLLNEDFIYPNPNEGVFKLKPDFKILSVIDALGRQLEYEQMGNLVQLNKHVKGTVVLQISDKSGAIYTQRILVQ
jgi:hypothetical protein